jgi:hypothetical protein
MSKTIKDTDSILNSVKSNDTKYSEDKLKLERTCFTFELSRLMMAKYIITPLVSNQIDKSLNFKEILDGLEQRINLIKLFIYYNTPPEIDLD